MRSDESELVSTPYIESDKITPDTRKATETTPTLNSSAGDITTLPAKKIIK